MSIVRVRFGSSYVLTVLRISIHPLNTVKHRTLKSHNNHTVSRT